MGRPAKWKDVVWGAIVDQLSVRDSLAAAALEVLFVCLERVSTRSLRETGLPSSCAMGAALSQGRELAAPLRTEPVSANSLLRDAA